MADTTEIPTASARGAQGADASSAPRCPRLFSVQQAADHHSLPTELVKDAIIAGELKRHNLDGRIRIDEDDLAAYVQSLELKWL